MEAIIEELRQTVQAVYRCGATHVASSHVLGLHDQNPAWDGRVELFTISGHPEATRCYAWNYPDGKLMRFVGVLEVPPVNSPQTAVLAALAVELKNKIQQSN